MAAPTGRRTFAGLEGLASTGNAPTGTHMTPLLRAALALGALASPLAAQTAAAPLRCDLSGYRAQTGLTAALGTTGLVVTWTGQDDAELRATFGIAEATPVVRELAGRRAGGAWGVLGQNLTPEYRVVSGVRRFSEQQADPLRELGLLTPERMEAEKWYAYRDSPLYIPPPPSTDGPGRRGRAQGGGSVDVPATAADIRRARSSFRSTGCTVATDGARLAVTFDGLSMGIFAGDLSFTVYRGASLLRMDALAATSEPSVAYKYDAGLVGFSTDHLARVTWNDVGGQAQQHRFGGMKNDGPVPVRAQNRVLVAEGRAGSLAAVPPPHAPFWARQGEINLGYVWYRKDAPGSFSMGTRQAEQEGDPQYYTTFALINARPGTVQHMGAYFLAAPAAAEATRAAVLALTHGDAYAPVPGYKTLVNHLHLGVTMRLRNAGSLDGEVRDMAPLRALGANIVGMSEFHGDGLRTDTGKQRFPDQADYATVSAKLSDDDFLVVPWEEPSAWFGGHYNILWPKSVLWSKTRDASQPFQETHPTLGTVYHTGSTRDLQTLLDAEGGYWYSAHPRTKGTAGYPDAVLDSFFVKSDRYLGVAYKMGMGNDLSEIRSCEWRCFDAIDQMNNRHVGTGLRPKYVIADIDSYEKGPEDDLYPTFPVTYLKLDRVPRTDESWAPILEALHTGESFVTTGEILIRGYAIEGAGARRTVVADLSWTFPLELVEVVWGDGKTVGRQTVRATDLAPNSTKRFEIPFDATGKAWVRFSAYDSAGNAAFAQPRWLDPENR